MKKQKFHRGDLVQVAKNDMMSSLASGCRAIVVGSYKDQYGGDDTSSYTLHTEGGGGGSWYDEKQLTLIATKQYELWEQWEREADARQEEADKQGDLGWLIENWKTKDLKNKLNMMGIQAIIAHAFGKPLNLRGLMIRGEIGIASLIAFETYHEIKDQVEPAMESKSPKAELSKIGLSHTHQQGISNENRVGQSQ